MRGPNRYKKEVFPLASKHHSLQMGEVADLLDLFQGFEQQNHVWIDCRLKLTTEHNSPDITVLMWAMEGQSEDTEVRPLASVSVNCLGTGLRNLRDVVIHALYALDFKLALLEISPSEPK